MFDTDNIRNKCLHLSQMLNRPNLYPLVDPKNQREMEENLYLLAQFPDLVPYGTCIGLTISSHMGVLHLAFDERGSTIKVKLHHRQPVGTNRVLSDLDGVALVAPKIIASATKIEIHGGTTPELWGDAFFFPLHSSNLQHWTPSQDHQQPGAGADGDDMMVL